MSTKEAKKILPSVNAQLGKSAATDQTLVVQKDEKYTRSFIS